MPGEKTKCASCKTKRNTRLCLDRESGALEIRETQLGLTERQRWRGVHHQKEREEQQ